MFQKSQSSLPLVFVALVALLAITGTGAALAGDGPDSFTAMTAEASVPNKLGISTTSMALTLPNKVAMVTFFNNQAAFTAAAPGLTLEDFENGSAGPGIVVGCLSTLSNSSPGACFPPGELVDGFAFSATTGVTVALGPGIVPVNPTTWVAADLFAAGSLFDFTDPDSLGADGCTISDLVGECAEGVNNHGQFVRCVSHLTNDLKRAGIITGADKGAIMSCAGQADIP